MLKTSPAADVWPTRVVFVLIDGLTDRVAQRMLGYMEGLIEAGIAVRGRVRSVLPSLSRPCYASIFSGTSPIVHGVVSNEQTARLGMPSLFDLLSQTGRSSAVAGYHWMSELFSRGPFDYVRDVEQDDNADGITHGRFYFLDELPDAHLFAQAESLRLRHHPDFLVIHPMGCDLAGHKHGSDSREYAGAAAKIDFLLARLVPNWLASGYQVVVTADHGMDAQGFHGGPDEQVRVTPLYMASPRLVTSGQQDFVVEQPQLAHLLCGLLGLAKSPSMCAWEQREQKILN